EGDSKFFDFTDSKPGDARNHVIRKVLTHHAFCGVDSLALLANGDTALFANGDAPCLAPQFSILLMNLINHKSMPPFVVHFSLVDSFVNKAAWRVVCISRLY